MGIASAHRGWGEAEFILSTSEDITITNMEVVKYDGGPGTATLCYGKTAAIQIPASQIALGSDYNCGSSSFNFTIPACNGVSIKMDPVSPGWKWGAATITLE